MRNWYRTIQGSNPDMGKKFFFSPKTPEWLWALPASYSMGIGFFSGVNRPAREVDHSHPSSTEDDNERSSTLLPLCVFMTWTGPTLWSGQAPLYGLDRAYFLVWTGLTLCPGQGPFYGLSRAHFMAWTGPTLSFVLRSILSQGSRTRNIYSILKSSLTGRDGYSLLQMSRRGSNRLP
jgi:hypothetical protein